jgi:hypothetical protein
MAAEINVSVRTWSQSAKATMTLDAALSELLTNCTDAYKGMFAPSGAAAASAAGATASADETRALMASLPVKLKIKHWSRIPRAARPVFVTIFPPDASTGDFGFLRVSDQATGLSFSSLKKCFITAVGVRTQEEGRRGFFSRGAKDCHALGDVRFESIKDGSYSSVMLDQWATVKVISEPRPATAEDRTRMCVPSGRNGTTVEIDFCASAAIPGAAKHVLAGMARNPMLDPIVRGHEATLYFRWASSPKYRRIQFPGRLDDMENVVSFSIKTCPTPVTNPAAAKTLGASLDLALADARDFDSGGVIIRGTHSVFGRTYFSIHNRRHPLAGHLRGILTAPYIEDLMHEADVNTESRTINPDNPFVPLDPARVYGLVERHPIVAELYKMASACVGEFLRSAEESRRLSQYQTQVVDCFDDFLDDLKSEGVKLDSLGQAPPRRRKRRGEDRPSVFDTHADSVDLAMAPPPPGKEDGADRLTSDAEAGTEKQILTRKARERMRRRRAKSRAPKETEAGDAPAAEASADDKDAVGAEAAKDAVDPEEDSQEPEGIKKMVFVIEYSPDVSAQVIPEVTGSVLKLRINAAHPSIVSHITVDPETLQLYGLHKRKIRIYALQLLADTVASMLVQARIDDGEDMSAAVALAEQSSVAAHLASVGGPILNALELEAPPETCVTIPEFLASGGVL